MKISPKRKISHRNIRMKTPKLVSVLLLLFVATFLIGGILYEQGLQTTLKRIVQGRFDELPDGAVKDAMEEIYSVVKSEKNAYSSNSLPNLYIDIPFENMQIIQQKRAEALETGILLASDDDYVSASVRYNDSAPMDVELRLKGDWTDHLEGDKWSYRIHIQDDAAIEGMRRFSIQAPETRNFVYEWAYHETLMREGILAPRYFFVNVIENGVNKGVYAMEESFYTELIESQERRSGVIVRYNEDDMWQNWANFYAFGKENIRVDSGASGTFMVAGFRSATISSFGMGSIVNNPVLLKEYQTAQQMLRGYQSGEKNASEVFDMDKMGKFITITELWGAGHALAWHNLRFYYNPVTNLLEPIGFDGIPMIEPYTDTDINYIVTNTIIMKDIENRKSFYNLSESILQENYIDQLRNGFSEKIDVFDEALSHEYKNYSSINWDRIMQRSAEINSKLYSIDVSGHYYLQEDSENTIVYTIENNYFLPLEISEIDINDVKINLSESMKQVGFVMPKLTSEDGIYQNAFVLPSNILKDFDQNEIAIKLVVANDFENYIWINLSFEENNSLQVN